MSKSNPLFIGGITGVLVIAAVAGAMSFRAEAGKNEREAKALLSQIRDEAQVDRELSAINERLQLCNKRLEHIVDERPEVAVSGLMTRLEQTGIASGLIVTGVRPKDDANRATASKDGDKPKPKDYVDQLIEVKGSGEYASVRSFVDGLDSFPNIVRVESLDISPRQNGTIKNSRGSLDITITLRAYLYPEVVQTPPATEEDKATGGSKVDPSSQTRLNQGFSGDKNGS